MIRTARVTKVKSVALVLLLFSGCSPIRGCEESSFDLAPDSRIPKWFSLPAGVQRSDVKVTME
jgi:hypothetical protein